MTGRFFVINGSTFSSRWSLVTLAKPSLKELINIPERGARFYAFGEYHFLSLWESNRFGGFMVVVVSEIIERDEEGTSRKTYR